MPPGRCRCRCWPSWCPVPRWPGAVPRCWPSRWRVPRWPAAVPPWRLGWLPGDSCRATPHRPCALAADASTPPPGRCPWPAEPVACAPLAGCRAPRGGWAGCVVICAGRRGTDPVSWPPTHRPYRQAGARGRSSWWRVPRRPGAVPPWRLGWLPGDLCRAPTLRPHRQAGAHGRPSWWPGAALGGPPACWMACPHFSRRAPKTCPRLHRMLAHFGGRLRLFRVARSEVSGGQTERRRTVANDGVVPPTGIEPVSSA